MFSHHVVFYGVCVSPHINFGIEWWMFMNPTVHIVPSKATHISYF